MLWAGSYKGNCNGLTARVLPQDQVQVLELPQEQLQEPELSPAQALGPVQGLAPQGPQSRLSPAQAPQGLALARCSVR